MLTVRRNIVVSNPKLTRGWFQSFRSGRRGLSPFGSRSVRGQRCITTTSSKREVKEGYSLLQYPHSFIRSTGKDKIKEQWTTSGTDERPRTTKERRSNRKARLSPFTISQDRTICVIQDGAGLCVLLYSNVCANTTEMHLKERNKR